MSVRPEFSDNLPSLRGPEGELVFVRLGVPARSLEDALDLLARASFPVNPEIRHGNPASVIEFPAYDCNVGEVRALARALGECSLEISSALLAIR